MRQDGRQRGQRAETYTPRVRLVDPAKGEYTVTAHDGVSWRRCNSRYMACSCRRGQFGFRRGGTCSHLRAVADLEEALGHLLGMLERDQGGALLRAWQQMGDGVQASAQLRQREVDDLT